MSYANESPDAQDPDSDPPPAAQTSREWPLVLGVLVVALTLLGALLYVAWWYFGGWFD